MKIRMFQPFLVFVILTIYSTCIHAQMVINTPQVDLIVNNTYMYQQVDKNTYKRVDIKFDNLKSETVFAIGTSEIETLQELKGKKNEILYVKDIKPYTSSDFKTFLSTNSWFNKIPNTNKGYLIKQYSSDITSLDELEFKKERYGGFGAYIEKTDDTIAKWRINKTNFLRTVVLNLGNDKHIALFLNANRSVFSRSKFLIPLKNKTQINFDNYFFKTSPIAVANDTLYNFDKKERAIFFKPDQFYKLKKTVNNQYKLIDEFNKDVLNKSFDTILFNNYFIIAKANNTYSIYNTWLKKLNISTIKEANFYHNGIEVLSSDGAKYFDADFERIWQFPTINYYLCGTVPHEYYTIEFNNKKKTPHTIKLGYDYDIEETLDLLGLITTDKVSFLNDALSYTWTGNDSFTNKKTVYPTLLKVKRGDKMGIVSYNVKNAKHPKEEPEKIVPKIKDPVVINGIIVEELESDLIIDEIRDVSYLGVVKVEEVLPFIYDDIEMRKDGLVYFYKDGKVGIYPRHKTVQYNSIWQRTNSYYEISRNGKTGWLDIKTNKEYFFNN